MENTDKKECSCQGGCSCGMGHMHGCHGRYHLVRMILRIVIVILIFWCGYRLGMITGSIRAGYGRYDGIGMMMRNDGGYNNLPVVTPANPVTPTP